jgi:hypothetical protein
LKLETHGLFLSLDLSWQYVAVDIKLPRSAYKVVQDLAVAVPNAGSIE